MTDAMRKAFAGVRSAIRSGDVETLKAKRIWLVRVVAELEGSGLDLIAAQGIEQVDARLAELESVTMTTVKALTRDGRTVELMRPTRADVEAVKAGRQAPSCFGGMAEVTEVFGRGVDIEGAAYVCYYTRFGKSGGTCSMSIKAGKVVRSVQATGWFNSAEISRYDEGARA